MTSNGKQFTVTREMLTAVARDQRWPDVVAVISARFSKFAFVLFCYITNHLMTGPLGKSEFCFPRISMFPSTSSRETLRFSGNKIHCSPRDQSLSVNYCILSRATLYNVLPMKEYFESDGTLMDAFMKSTIQSNNLGKRKNNHTKETPRILPSKVSCYRA